MLQFLFCYLSSKHLFVTKLIIFSLDTIYLCSFSFAFKCLNFLVPGILLRIFQFDILACSKRYTCLYYWYNYRSGDLDYNFLLLYQFFLIPITQSRSLPLIQSIRSGCFPFYNWFPWPISFFPKLRLFLTPLLLLS